MSCCRQLQLLSYCHSFGLTLPRRATQRGHPSSQSIFTKAQGPDSPSAPPNTVIICFPHYWSFVLKQLNLKKEIQFFVVWQRAHLRLVRVSHIKSRENQQHQSEGSDFSCLLPAEVPKIPIPYSLPTTSAAPQCSQGH